MKDQPAKSIIDMANGQIRKNVNREMERIIENIMDEKTPAEAKRKLTITVSIKPSEISTFLTVETSVKSTLAPEANVVTAMHVTADEKTGELGVYELTTEIPGQIDILDSPGGQIMELVRKES